MTIIEKRFSDASVSDSLDLHGHVEGDTDIYPVDVNAPSLVYRSGVMLRWSLLTAKKNFTKTYDDWTESGRLDA